MNSPLILDKNLTYDIGQLKSFARELNLPFPVLLQNLAKEGWLYDGKTKTIKFP